MALPINPGTIDAVEGLIKAHRNSAVSPHPAHHRRHPNAPDSSSDAVEEAIKNGMSPEDIQRLIAQQGPGVANEVNHASFGEKAMGWAETVAEAPNKVAMWFVLPSMLAGWATKTVGGWIDKDPAKPGKVSRSGHQMTMPVRWMNQSFETFGEKTRLGKPVGWVTQKLTNAVAVPGQWLTKRFGMDTRRAAYHATQIDHHFDVAKGMLDGEHGAKIKSFIETEKGLEKFKGLTDRVEAAKANGTMASMHNELHEFHQVAKGIHPSKRGQLREYAEATLASSYHDVRKNSWKAGKGISEVTNVIKKAPVAHTLWNAGFLAGDTIAMFGTAKTLKENIHSLKQMYADMKGMDVSQVSTAKIMFGSLPKPIAQERAKVMKHLGIDAALQGVSAFFSVKQLRNGHFSGTAQIIQAGSALGGDKLKSFFDASYAPEYGHLSAAQHRGQKLSAQVYAEFLRKVDSRFDNRHSEPITLALAQKFEQSQIKVGGILKLHARHELQKLGKATAQEMGKEDPQANALPTQQTASHAASLSSQNQVLKPVYGKHTLERNEALKMKMSMPPIPGRP